MASISSCCCLVASNLWPKRFGDLILCGQKVNPSTYVTTVPRKMEDMLSWASVEQDPIYHGIPVALCLVYWEALPSIQPIAINLYGFLQDFNLRPFGDWNG